jgi:hypothetical protein
MTNDIVFTNTLEFDFFPPKPATTEVPDWYKNTSSTIENENKEFFSGETPHTIKKCMPVFDAITAGYILYTQVDVQVTQQDGLPFYRWPSQNFIEFHPIAQAPLHPQKKNGPYPKFNNQYIISTPPGYSVLIAQPFHRESVFTILPGIIDTDTYKSPILFPFTLNNQEWEGLIPAGTPMAQVIPFKRESWKYKNGSEKEIKESHFINRKLKTLFFNSYKRQFWHKKDYR